MERRGYIKKDFESSEIPLWLDDYNDLFSDFDPRDYSHRALSQDFLEELKLASKDKTKILKIIKLKIFVPKSTRNIKEENIIQKRLKEHFMKHFLILKKENNKTIRQGLIFFIVGSLFMLLTTYFLINKKDSYILNLISVFLEPGGWFFFWEGLNLIVFEAKKRHPDLKFYKKMSRIKIEFLDIK